MASPSNDGPPRLIEEVARAKVNLDLRVTGRRSDGYHELDSVVVFPEIADLVRVDAADALSLTIGGPFGEELPDPEDNLVMRAARALAALSPSPRRARIELVKNLPIASGIGGGSSDAAATLRALRRFWQIDIDDSQLRDLGLELGADLPACLYGRSLRMRGIGERIDPLRGLPELPLLLVNPGVAVATAEVFKRLARIEPAHRVYAFPPHASLLQFSLWLSGTHNDLQEPAIAIAPAIGEVIEALLGLSGCLQARMSGSGATCWALFSDRGEVESAAAHLRSVRPQWWVEPAIVASDQPGAG